MLRQEKGMLKKRAILGQVDPDQLLYKRIGPLERIVNIM